MLTKEFVKESVINQTKKSECIDSRDFSRLAEYYPVEEWEIFGVKLRDGKQAPTPKEWTRKNILEDLKSDVEFGFEKALGRRGISAGLMNECIKMWMWVLEDELQTHNNYAQYGLPLLKAVAVKYGFKNEIGDDTGSEDKYSMEGE